MFHAVRIKNMFFQFAYFAVAVTVAHASVIPNLPKCKLEDSACMKDAFQKAAPTFVEGIPELGTEVLDVMDMDPVEFDLSGLQFTLTDGKLKGHKNMVFDNVQWDTKNNKLNIQYRINSTIKGHYTAGGRILILPITGDGQMKLRLRNIEIKLELFYKMEVDENGKNHVIPTKYEFDFDVKDNALFELTNLFNGNKQLSDTMLKFLNENWKQISVEFGRPLMGVAAKKIFKNVVMFLTKVPIEDIAEL